MRRSLHVLIASITLSVGLAVCSSSATASAATLPEGNLGTAVANFVASPNALAGVNDWNCKPSAAHPYPVVLEHASLVNFGSNFVKLAPRLKNAGYCVFAENYGMTIWSAGRVGGLGKATDSVNSFSSFVSRVLSTTGAQKIDVVGHSQGGEIPFAYIKLDGGANKVAHYVSWGGTQHGTTLLGLASLGNALGVLGFVQTVSGVIQTPGMTDQAIGSDFQKKLWATPDVPAGPQYTTIQSTHDEVSTPYYNQSLAGANNIVIQDRCPSDPTGHIGMFLDEPTIELTMNALADGPANFQLSCTGYGVGL